MLGLESSLAKFGQTPDELKPHNFPDHRQCERDSQSGWPSLVFLICCGRHMIWVWGRLLSLDTFTSTQTIVLNILPFHSHPTPFQISAISKAHIATRQWNAILSPRAVSISPHLDLARPNNMVGSRIQAQPCDLPHRPYERSFHELG